MAFNRISTTDMVNTEILTNLLVYFKQNMLPIVIAIGSCNSNSIAIGFLTIVIVLQ